MTISGILRGIPWASHPLPLMSSLQTILKNQGSLKGGFFQRPRRVHPPAAIKSCWLAKLAGAIEQGGNQRKHKRVRLRSPMGVSPFAAVAALPKVAIERLNP